MIAIGRPCGLTPGAGVPCVPFCRFALGPANESGDLGMTPECVGAGEVQRQFFLGQHGMDLLVANPVHQGLFITTLRFGDPMVPVDGGTINHGAAAERAGSKFLILFHGRHACDRSG